MSPKIDKMCMEVAQVMAKQSTCLRRQVGCVIVDINGYILSTGYNGTPSGEPHCDERNCLGRPTCNAIHAEQNAIARLTLPRDAWALYCTTKPCLACQKLISVTSIELVIYGEETGVEHFSNKFQMVQYENSL